MSTSAGSAELKTVPWRTEFLRLILLVVAGTVLGIATNQFSKKPVPILSANGPGALPERAPRITAEVLKNVLNSDRPPLLIDVRNEDEYKVAHALNAVNAPAKSFADAYTKLDLRAHIQSSDFVVLMCESSECPLADRAAKVLNMFGHNNVRVLQGGWDAYQKAALPLGGSQ